MGNSSFHQTYNFLEAKAETNYKELLRLAYYEQVKSDAESFYNIKEMVDESETIQKVLFDNHLKFPNAQADMDGFLESLTQENSQTILGLVN